MKKAHTIVNGLILLALVGILVFVMVAGSRVFLDEGYVRVEARR